MLTEKIAEEYYIGSYNKDLDVLEIFVNWINVQYKNTSTNSFKKECKNLNLKNRIVVILKLCISI